MNSNLSPLSLQIGKIALLPEVSSGLSPVNESALF